MLLACKIDILDSNLKLCLSVSVQLETFIKSPFVRNWVN